MPYKTPLKLEILKNKRKEYIDSLRSKQKKPSLLNRIALWITNNVGSMRFFLLVFCWTAIWLGWNMFAPKAVRFDPYPAFVLWLFISNMIQLFLMPLIMIGQNLQATHADLRSEVDFKINELAAVENETILIHLENQNDMILKILQNIEKMNKGKKDQRG